MTDEQIDSMFSAGIVQPVGGIVKMVKNDDKTFTGKTPLELQVNMLCSKLQNSKQSSSSENWVNAIFDNIESLLGKDKVRCNKTAYTLYNITKAYFCYTGVYCVRSHVRYPIWSTRFGGHRFAFVRNRIF